MTGSDEGDTFRLAPLPLASGTRWGDLDGPVVTEVELLVTTADGGTTRLPLRRRHGAWWPPTPPEG